MGIEETKASQEKPRSIEEILEILHKEGFKVQPPANQEYFSDIPKREGFEGLPPAGHMALKHLVDAGRTYLGGYIVEDSYGDERESREERGNHWRKIEMTYGQDVAHIHARDKMRLGSMVNNVVGSFDWTVTELDGANIHTTQAEKIRELQQSLLAIVPDAKVYAQMMFDERVAMTQSIDAILREMLAAITEKNETSVDTTK